MDGTHQMPIRRSCPTALQVHMEKCFSSMALMRAIVQLTFFRVSLQKRLEIRPKKHGPPVRQAVVFLDERGLLTYTSCTQLHPLVEPQVSHFSQVPLRTMVKFWHSEHMLPV